MHKLMLALAATSLTMPAMPAHAEGRGTYKGKVWRDSDGRLRCKRPDGTTGLIVGGAGGALLGRAIDTPRRARHGHDPRRRRRRAARPPASNAAGSRCR